MIKEAIELTKAIPGSDILTPLSQEDNNLTPYPEIEFDVVVEPTVDKFKNKINSMSQNWRQAEWWMNVIQTVSGVRFYQLMCRWNVDANFGPEPEMPSKKSEAGCQGPESLHIPGLENEPDLYEDVEKDAA